MVYLFLIFLATLSLICDSFECHLSSLPCTASFFLLIRLQFHFIIFWFNCAEGIEHWRQVMHFFGMGNICLHRDYYSFNSSFSTKPSQFCMDDGGSSRATELN
jgi:hypothetical protein